MWIERLELKNFRGFAACTLDLDRQLTVLAGVNGVGKTTVLDGLAVAMGAWFLGFSDAPKRNIELAEVRFVQMGEGHADFERQYPVVVEAHGELGAAGLHWTRSKNSDSGTTTRSDSRHLVDVARAHQKDVQAGLDTDLPVFAYYGTGRLWQTPKPKQGKGGAGSSRTSGYIDALNPRSDHKHFAAWMKWRQYDQLQRHAQSFQYMTGDGVNTHATEEMVSSISREVDDPWLHAVEQAVVKCVDGAKRFYFSVNTDQLVIELKGGSVQPFSTLSDGYKNLIAMVADIAWRATRLNSHHEEEAPHFATGVVLIDEIELHLHPEWQLSVLSKLTKAFPNLQFVVTTHAPLVLGSVPASQIRFLTAEGGVHGVNVAQGLSANVVLRELMGVHERDTQVAEDIAELGRQLEAGEVAKSRASFDALRTKLGTLDPELQGLEWELRNLEVHGAEDQ